MMMMMMIIDCLKWIVILCTDNEWLVVSCVLDVGE